MKVYPPPPHNTFECGDCKEVKPVHTDGGTGYGIDPHTNQYVCYACCGVRDLTDMHDKGKALLYLSTDNLTVTNWPNTLRFPIDRKRKGRHNIAGTRLDVWFKDDQGQQWHGVVYGRWTEVVHCTRSKTN
jgi:hypothetical protein